MGWRSCELHLMCERGLSSSKSLCTRDPLKSCKVSSLLLLPPFPPSLECTFFLNLYYYYNSYCDTWLMLLRIVDFCHHKTLECICDYGKGNKIKDPSKKTNWSDSLPPRRYPTAMFIQQMKQNTKSTHDTCCLYPTQFPRCLYCCVAM